MLSDEGVDGVVFISLIFGKQESWDFLPIIMKALEKFQDKPVVCWLYGEKSGTAIARLNENGRVAVFPSCERAVRALSRLWEYASFLGRVS